MVHRKQHVKYAIKQFYSHFKQEQERFLQAVQGTSPSVDRRWHATLLLIHLMLIYFLQKKGLLDGDSDYLHNCLRRIQRQKSRDPARFLTFYREVFLRLFHEELSQQQRSPELEKLTQKLFYLHGGIFNQSAQEQALSELHIPDNAFERLFTFFDRYLWHLDTSVEPGNNEINPDVINYVFEQFMKQRGKQQGIYYTKENITLYMASNTIIPRLLDTAAQRCPAAFLPHGPVWRLLQDTPDRYIHDAIKKGCSTPLPPEIAAGRESIARRAVWNLPLPSDFRDNALPTETWHELVARRQHYAELRAMLSAGTVTTVNDLIMLNLDICRFMQDVIENSTDIHFIWAIYCTLTGTGQGVFPASAPSTSLSVIDPTCGSGAFLLAALHVLEPIYASCLHRMQQILSENELLPGPSHVSASQSHHILQAFHHCLGVMQQYPNRSFFILQSIIANNLYGIDLMPEAAEICRLRLFLQLVASIDSLEHINYLPAIDFNIRVGNALVSIGDRRRFDVIIGNPPYIASRAVDYALSHIEMTFPNIYASLLLRTLSLCTDHSRLGMIVPLSLMFSKGFMALRNTLTTAGYSWFSSFDTIPAALFPGVNQRCTIWLAARSTEAHLFVTPMYRWRSEAHSTLFTRLYYISLKDHDVATSGIPKLATMTQQHIFMKIKAASTFPLQSYQSQVALGFSQAARNFISVFLEPPPCLNAQTLAPTTTSKIGTLRLPSRQAAFVALALLTGDVYFWYWQVRGDGFDVTRWIITDFLAIMNTLPTTILHNLAQLGRLLHARRSEALVFKKNAGKYVGNYNYRTLSHLTRRADLLLLSALNIERIAALELLYDVQRVLSINKQAGEKGIPDSIKRQFIAQPTSIITEQNLLATIDTLLTSSYRLSLKELHAICNKIETSD